jgi:hypothetical protein
VLKIAFWCDIVDYHSFSCLPQLLIMAPNSLFNPQILKFPLLCYSMSLPGQHHSFLPLHSFMPWMIP